jgi:hypothetical protein
VSDGGREHARTIPVRLGHEGVCGSCDDAEGGIAAGHRCEDSIQGRLRSGDEAPNLPKVATAPVLKGSEPRACATNATGIPLMIDPGLDQERLEPELLVQQEA